MSSTQPDTASTTEPNTAKQSTSTEHGTFPTLLTGAQIAWVVMQMQGEGYAVVQTYQLPNGELYLMIGRGSVDPAYNFRLLPMNDGAPLFALSGRYAMLMTEHYPWHGDLLSPTPDAAVQDSAQCDCGMTLAACEHLQAQNKAVSDFGTEFMAALDAARTEHEGNIPEINRAELIAKSPFGVLPLEVAPLPPELALTSGDAPVEDTKPKQA